MRIVKVVGFMVVTFVVGYAIVTRIPPLWALLNRQG